MRHARFSLLLTLALLLVTRAASAAPADFTLDPVPPPAKLIDAPPATQPFKLSEHRGQFVALHFLLKTECPFCLKHTRDYTKRAGELPSVTQVFIKPDSVADIQQWMLDLKAPTLIYRDPDAALAKAFAIPDGFKFHGQVVHYPALVLIGPDGKEVFRYIGKDNTDRLPFDKFAAEVAARSKATTQPAGGKNPASRPAAQRVSRIGMTVGDLDRSIAFLTNVLDFTKQSEVEVAGKDYEQLTGIFRARSRIAVLRLGDEEVELSDYLTGGGRAVPTDSHSNDLWFQHIAIITSDMDAAYARLREHKVRFTSTGPQTLPAWNKNAAGIRAFYFRDPDNHVLEVLQFPTGKGEPKWAALAAHGGLFLGIDHTAIVVTDTEASLHFYRDTLGMRIAGGSENYGDEQAHLNNVEGARVRITTLRAASGPGVELLQYLAPGGGRPFPADARANDLFHWQVTMTASDVGGAATAMAVAHSPPVSMGTVDVNDASLGVRRAIAVRDPDGHAIQLVE